MTGVFVKRWKFGHKNRHMRRAPCSYKLRNAKDYQQIPEARKRQRRILP